MESGVGFCTDYARRINMGIWSPDYRCVLVESDGKGGTHVGAWRDAPGGDFSGAYVELTKAQTLELIAELQRLVDE